MLVALLAFVSQTPAAAPTPLRGNLRLELELNRGNVPAELLGDEIVVTAPQIYRALLATRTDRATRRRVCVLRRALGIAALDATLCPDTLACAETNPTRRAVATCVTGRLSATIETLSKAPGGVLGKQ